MLTKFLSEIYNTQENSKLEFNNVFLHVIENLKKTFNGNNYSIKYNLQNNNLQIELSSISGDKNLILELTDKYIQVVLTDNCEIFINLDPEFILNLSKTFIDSVFSGNYNLNYHLNKSGKIVFKQILWNDFVLEKYNKIYKKSIFLNKYISIKTENGFSFTKRIKFLFRK